MGIGTGAWFLTRPTPAIAFNERDWVVVGDLRNLTGQPVLDESLEQAFRISLEQSRYVNVLSDLKVRDTLALMKRKPDTQLDRTIASEIAIRDGARAVILPTVAEVGGRVRVSAEVIDPHSQTTVYAESADGVGAESTLGSIDEVTGELREKLGEAIAAIERDSAPLPKVSTTDLDALKAYALGEKKYAEGDAAGAVAYFRQALSIDPAFALAQAALGRVLIGDGMLADGRKSLERAATMRDNLTPREAMTVETTLARFGPVPQLLDRWQRLSEMYPDLLSARLGYAQDGWMMANRFDDMLPHARAATAPQNPNYARAFYLQGILLLGMERYADATRAFEASRKAGFKGGGAMYAYTYEARRAYADATRIYSARGGTVIEQRDLNELEFDFAMAVDRGEWSKLESTARQAMPLAEKEDVLMNPGQWRLWASNADVLAGRATAAQLQGQLDWVAKNAQAIDAIYAGSQDYRLALGYLAARAGHSEVLDAALDALGDGRALRDFPTALQAREVLLAEQDRLAGRPRPAIARLAKLVRSPSALAIVHSAYARALAADKRYAEAREQARWLATHRGRVFTERATSSLLDPINIADTTLAELDIAEWSKALGDAKEAGAAAARFRKAWQVGDLPPNLRARVAKL